MECITLKFSCLEYSGFNYMVQMVCGNSLLNHLSYFWCKIPQQGCLLQLEGVNGHRTVSLSVVDMLLSDVREVRCRGAS